MKKSVEDLAVLGGSPAFSEALHVGRPNIGDRQRLLGRVNDLLVSKWLTNDGPYLQEFERRVAEMIGVKHCIATCNATVALEIAIRALELAGEVIVPSFTFIATAHALQWQSITPVFCDVDQNSHNIDPRQVEQMITSRTTGILGVHLWGRACDADALTDIARRHNLKLLFDAAHAFACSSKGIMIGTFGDAEVFSFHATKFLNTFEGGAVVTNNDALAAKIRLMRSFGFADYDTVVCLGTNGKMSEISAVMGLTSLDSMEEFITHNDQNYLQYQEGLADIPGVTLLRYDRSEKCNYHYIVLEIDEAVTRISRDTLQKILWSENVLARRYFYPGCHRMEPYLSNFPNAPSQLPNTERLITRVLCLPTGTAVGTSEIEEICRILQLAISHQGKVRTTMGHQLYERTTNSGG
jgi:dTDP-4-amino-4,6-dideoxygalactose transaminase